MGSFSRPVRKSAFSLHGQLSPRGRSPKPTFVSWKPPLGFSTLISPGFRREIRCSKEHGHCSMSKVARFVAWAWARWPSVLPRRSRNRRVELHSGSSACGVHDIDASRNTEAAPVVHKVEDYGVRERRELQASVFARSSCSPCLRQNSTSESSWQVLLRSQRIPAYRKTSFVSNSSTPFSFRLQREAGQTSLTRPFRDDPSQDRAAAIAAPLSTPGGARHREDANACQNRSVVTFRRERSSSRDPNSYLFKSCRGELSEPGLRQQLPLTLPESGLEPLRLRLGSGAKSITTD